MRSLFRMMTASSRRDKSKEDPPPTTRGRSHSPAGGSSGGRSRSPLSTSRECDAMHAHQPPASAAHAHPLPLSPPAPPVPATHKHPTTVPPPHPAPTAHAHHPAGPQSPLLALFASMESPTSAGLLLSPATAASLRRSASPTSPRPRRQTHEFEYEIRENRVVSPKALRPAGHSEHDASQHVKPGAPSRLHFDPGNPLQAPPSALHRVANKLAPRQVTKETLCRTTILVPGPFIPTNPTNPSSSSASSASSGKAANSKVGSATSTRGPEHPLRAVLRAHASTAAHKKKGRALMMPVHKDFSARSPPPVAAAAAALSLEAAMSRHMQETESWGHKTKTQIVCNALETSSPRLGIFK